MILIDTGPLLALAGDSSFSSASAIRAYVLRLPDNFITTPAVFTEALYLTHKRGGPTMQLRLWQFWQVKVFEVLGLNSNDLDRCRQYMLQYASRPMDFADATLVVTAENLQTRRILTTDSDFYVYLLRNKEAFDVIPLA